MKKILVVEDNDILLDNTSEILSLSNYQVFSASNGKQGIELALANKPDLILCDIMMPVLDGYAVLHMLRMNPEFQNTPFIFLTALSEQKELRKGMSLGADDYIIKPFDPNDLLITIENRLKRAELTRSIILQECIDVNNQNIDCDSEKLLLDFVEGRHIDIYKKRQRIFSEGNHPIRIYYVVKGKIKIFKRNDLGKEFIVKIINKGEFFGYAPVFENSVYKENADALEDSEIAAIPRNEFEELIHSKTEVSRQFLKMLAIEVTEKENQLLHIAYASLRKKVAEALLAVHKKYQQLSGSGDISLSRENLAAIAGTATESLIRTLTDFKAEKLIDVKDGKVCILNIKKLEQLTN
jgi:DNA-binding response OmpR family regulator